MSNPSQSQEWACCTSTIGPVCKHKEGLVRGWYVYRCPLHIRNHRVLYGNYCPIAEWVYCQSGGDGYLGDGCQEHAVLVGPACMHCEGLGCARCNGGGLVMGTCPTCNGTGKI